MDVLVHQLANRLGRAVVGHAHHHDEVPLRQQAVRLQLKLLRNLHVLLVLRAHVQVVESLEDPDGADPGLARLGEVLFLRLPELPRIRIHQVEPCKLLQGPIAHDKMLDLLVLYTHG